MNQIVATEMLSGEYVVDVVCNGKLAVEAIARQAYDVVLMDCQMPEMDGFAAVAAIRTAEGQGKLKGRLPVIALTANAVKGDREKCLKAGMDGYVSKPIEPDALVGEIELMLAGKEFDGGAAATAPEEPIATPLVAEAPKHPPRRSMCRRSCGDARARDRWLGH